MEEVTSQEDARRSALIGLRLEELDTPTLLLDGAACQRNLERMSQAFAGQKCQLRPHFKNHKCVTLARHQLAAGNAVGMTCAKLGEAEVLAHSGFPDLLVANQVLGAPKVARLVKVARETRIAVAIDDLSQATEISQAAAAGGVKVGVLIEVDGGMGRCGLPPGEPVLKLAQQISGLPGIELRGLQCYEGHAVYVDDRAKRDEMTRAGLGLAVETRRLLESNGIPVEVLSGGSSSTYATSGRMEGVDEIQAGTYATMDWRYHQLVPEFEIALSILVRVISAQGDKFVIDLGVKGAGAEFGVPMVKGHPEVEVPFFKAEEHCVMRGGPTRRVGETFQVFPSHACTTCNLYREMVVHDGERVTEVWPIEASGRLA
jgi:D-serine deaminase-like pyridoxal phosphate-dependent protein